LSHNTNQTVVPCPKPISDELGPGAVDKLVPRHSHAAIKKTKMTRRCAGSTQPRLSLDQRAHHSVRKLAVEAADNGLLAPELAAGITR